MGRATLVRMVRAIVRRCERTVSHLVEVSLEVRGVVLVLVARVLVVLDSADRAIPTVVRAFPVAEVREGTAAAVVPVDLVAASSPAVQGSFSRKTPRWPR